MKSNPFQASEHQCKSQIPKWSHEVQDKTLNWSIDSSLKKEKEKDEPRTVKNKFNSQTK